MKNKIILQGGCTLEPKNRAILTGELNNISWEQEEEFTNTTNKVQYLQKLTLRTVSNMLGSKQ